MKARGFHPCAHKVKICFSNFAFKFKLYRYPQADSTEQMRRILAAKYMFPTNVTPAFKDIVKRLLSVNTVQRLGCLKGGVKDVKQHAWLRTVDWVQMTKRTIPAPFVPPITGDDDTSCFDDYDIKTAHPGDAFMAGKSNQRGVKGDEVFNSF